MATATQIIKNRLGLPSEHPAAQPLAEEWADQAAALVGETNPVRLAGFRASLVGPDLIDALERDLNLWITARFMPNLAAELAAAAHTKPAPWAGIDAPALHDQVTERAYKLAPAYFTADARSGWDAAMDWFKELTEGTTK